MDGWKQNLADYNNFGWAVEPKLKWLPMWVMYLLLSVSLLLHNLPPSVITTSFEITRMMECWFHFIIQISVFLADIIWRRIRLAELLSADIRRTKFRRRICLSVAAWGSKVTRGYRSIILDSFGWLGFLVLVNTWDAEGTVNAWRAWNCCSWLTERRTWL